MLHLSVFATLLAVTAAIGGASPGKDPENCTRTGKAELRISACSEAILSEGFLGSNVAAAYRLRGLAFSDARDYRRAITDYDWALRINPSDSAVYFERATAYTRLQDYSQAIEDYDRSLHLEPGNPQAYFLRGVNNYQLGEHSQAIIDYGQALVLDPEYSPVYNERAWVLYLVGRNSEALEDTAQALSRHPRMAPALDTRAHVLAALGRPSEALIEFERAIDAGGKSFVRMYQKALIRHGHYTGETDGVYGAEVRAALAACLEEHCRLVK
ncbi:MAG TPA: tetratricopeptide repeat protein [Thermohalobaculum sp.]|nr:tetratricopeptide repeat protein [Thermohalobaculum sp.]